jgi:hypothetical protein
MSFRIYMKRAEFVFRIAIVVCMTAWTAQASPSPQFAPMQTNLEESDIDRMEKELADPATRLAALAALADFGARKLYQVGSVFFVDSDAKTGALRERAAKLAMMCNDIDTISRALDSDDRRLQMWGLWFWCPDCSRPALNEQLTYKETRWYALMPKVRRLAKDSIHRSIAIDKLSGRLLPENREFLLSLIPTEKSAGVIIRLLHRTEMRRIGEPSKRDERFNEELLRLLADPDVKVRIAALADIALNWNNAEMFQARFGANVSQRVEELRKSDDDEEKRLANWAAEGLEKIAKIWLERDSAKTKPR